MTSRNQGLSSKGGREERPWERGWFGTRSIRPRFEFPKSSYVEWNGIFHQAGPILFFYRLSTFPTKRSFMYRMMSSSANYRPFLSSFRHTPPQEHFVKLANSLFRQNMTVYVKCLFDQNWAEIPWTYTSGHLQGQRI